MYLILGFIFYFILFDFSRGALDKYLMFLVVPLVMICAPILRNIFIKDNKKALIIAVIVSAGLMFINFLPHEVLPLYPKTAWFSRVLHLDWLFVNPFMGGSGPLGFYVSFLFIVSGFIVGLIASILYFIKKEWKSSLLLILVVVSSSYNIVFAEELFLGKINGNSAKVLGNSLNFISSNENIKSVITYNDGGSYELTHMGKHAGRFYAVPAFESFHTEVFTKHNGYFLVVDVPHISEDIFYGKYFAKCDTVYSSTSGRITGYVYDCRK
jgi:hypothetical protein